MWVVADGMGGHDAGDFASETIVDQASKFTRQNSLDASILLLEENLLHSNQIIREKAAKLGSKATIGSTVAALHVWKNLAMVLWAGDSRIYLLRSGELHRLTEDHSYVEELVRMGKISQQEADEHPAANVVLNAIGIQDELTIDMDYFEIQDQDVFILCTDGLFKEVMDDKMIEVLETRDTSIEQLNQNLIQTALENGGGDNCTVILVKATAEIEHV